MKKKSHMGLKTRLQINKRQDWRNKHVKKQDGRCYYCKNLFKRQKGTGKIIATLDHIVPTSRGGADHWENTCAACQKCNHAKGSMTGDEFLKTLKTC